MKYCMHCSSLLKEKSIGQYRCPKCDARLYDNPKPGVSSFIITNNNKVLLGVRSKEPYRGMLDGLGGFVDTDETFEQALYRELKEEAGLTKAHIYSMTYLTSVCDDYPWQPLDHKVTSAYFVVKLKPSATLVPNDDVSEIVELDYKNIDQDLFAWQGMRDAYSEFKKHYIN